jgi:hypothetical protein
MSALAHRTTSGVSINGVVPGELGEFQISNVGAKSFQVSSGAVAHANFFNSSEIWWTASWEESFLYTWGEWDTTSGTYKDFGVTAPSETWLFGVERLASGRCVYNLALISGDTYTTKSATYTNKLGSFATNFIPLAKITRSLGNIVSIEQYRNNIYEGRFVSQPVLSSSFGVKTLVGLGPSGFSLYDNAVQTITERTAGTYYIDVDVDVQAMNANFHNLHCSVLYSVSSINGGSYTTILSGFSWPNTLVRPDFIPFKACSGSVVLSPGDVVRVSLYFSNASGSTTLTYQNLHWWVRLIPLGGR